MSSRARFPGKKFVSTWLWCLAVGLMCHASVIVSSSSAQTDDQPGESPAAEQVPGPPPDPGPSPFSKETAFDNIPDSDQATEPKPGPEGAAPGPEASAQQQPEGTATPEASAAPAEATDATASSEGAGAEPATDETGWSTADEVGFGTASDHAGFADTDEALTDGEPPKDEGRLTLDSFFRTQEALWTERFKDNPFAKARQSLDADLRYKQPFDVGAEDLHLDLAAGLHLEYDLAYQHDRDSYDDPTLDEYESLLLGREMFAGLSYDVLDITFGRQIVAWGEGIVLSPIDVVNPRDDREPYLVDLDDMRIAVLATRVGLFLGDHRLESMIVHESYFGLRPPPLAPYSPFRQLILDDPTYGPLFEGDAPVTLKYEDVPGRFMKKGTQFLQRWTYSGHGFDVALYAASVLDKMGVAELPSTDDLAEGTLPIRLWHPRYTMLAHSGSVPVEDFLIKWELGVDLERPINVTDTAVEDFNLDVEEYTQIKGMLGLHYTGLDDTQFILEYAQSYVVDNPERSDDPDDSSTELLFPVEQPVIMLRGERTFLHERLNLTAMAMLFGIWDYTGWLARIEVWYELVDALKLGLGYMTYQPTDDNSTIFGFETHDRLYATVRWDFLLE